MEEKDSQTSLYPAPIVVVKARGVKRSLEAFTENIIVREQTLYIIKYLLKIPHCFSNSFDNSNIRHLINTYIKDFFRIHTI